jgi:hypothetical protein
VSADIRPLRGAPCVESLPAADGGEVLEVRILPPWPRIPAAIYEARSVKLRTQFAFKRRYVEALFDIYDGEFIGGRVLARLPGFFPLPALRRPLARSSALARWITLLSPYRLDRIPLRTLEHKLWRVRVADVVTSHARNLLSAPLIYSKVAEVLEHL